MKTNGWPLPWNNNKESSLKCYSEYIIKYLLRFPRKGSSWQELRKKGLVSFRTSLKSLIDFLIFLNWFVENFILGKNQKKSFGRFEVLGIFRFCREPCFTEEIFCFLFFKNHDVFFHKKLSYPKKEQ
jgi:hypothetical protein